LEENSGKISSQNVHINRVTYLNIACRQLVDENRIKKSLVLPFRLIVAWKQLNSNDRHVRKMRNALEDAIDIACNNVPDLENTLVVVDNSVRLLMAQQVSNSKHMLCNEMGADFAMILAKRCNADIIEFGNLARYINYNLRDSVMDFSSKFAGNNKLGHGTGFHSIFNRANKLYDRIVIFSDMQGWVGHTNPTTSLNAYKAKTGANPFIYSFDLAGYGSLQFPENKVFGLAGFSEKAFDLMSVLEIDRNALVNKIAAIEL
jgi:60 kDa SS-A/Ro ribonucleoprotein